MAAKQNVFLSYARDDDEQFVARLYTDLVAQGTNIWWDRVSMPSRGLMFNEEIRNAIDTRDRLIEVVGPAAVESLYVRQEWEYALSVCKVVIPILRIGDYDLLPEELKHFHCPDFRDSARYDQALQELLRILREDLTPIGDLHEVPALPPHFIPRYEHLGALQKTVMADVVGPTIVTSTQQ